MLSNPLHWRKMCFGFPGVGQRWADWICGCILTPWPPLDSQVTAAVRFLWSVTFLRHFKGPGPLRWVCLSATPGTCQPQRSSWPTGSSWEPARISLMKTALKTAGPWDQSGALSPVLFWKTMPPPPRSDLRSSAMAKWGILTGNSGNQTLFTQGTGLSSEAYVKVKCDQNAKAVNCWER